MLPLRPADRGPDGAVLVFVSLPSSRLPALREVLEPRGFAIQVLTRNQCPVCRGGDVLPRAAGGTFHGSAARTRSGPSTGSAAASRARPRQQQLRMIGNQRASRRATCATDLAGGHGPDAASGPPSPATSSCSARRHARATCSRASRGSPPGRLHDRVPAEWRDVRAAEQAAARRPAPRTSTRRAVLPRRAVPGGRRQHARLHRRPSPHRGVRPPAGAQLGRLLAVGWPRPVRGEGLRHGPRTPARWSLLPPRRRSTRRRRCRTTRDRSRSPTCCRPAPIEPSPEVVPAPEPV